MNINLTILGQSLAFIVFVWFCLKFIWPPLIGALRERQRQIAVGLKQAEAAKESVVQAEATAEQLRQATRAETQTLLERANRRADQIIEQAKQQATEEGAQLKAAAKADIDLEVNRAREGLRAEVAHLAVLGAEQIVRAQVDAKKHSQMLSELAAKL